MPCNKVQKRRPTNLQEPPAFWEAQERRYEILYATRSFARCRYVHLPRVPRTHHLQRPQDEWQPKNDKHWSSWPSSSIALNLSLPGRSSEYTDKVLSETKSKCLVPTAVWLHATNQMAVAVEWLQCAVCFLFWTQISGWCLPSAPFAREESLSPGTVVGLSRAQARKMHPLLSELALWKLWLLSQASCFFIYCWYWVIAKLPPPSRAVQVVRTNTRSISTTYCWWNNPAPPRVYEKVALCQ